MLIINPSAQDSRQGALLTEHGKYEKIGLPTDGISSAKQKKKELDIKTLLKTHQGKYIKDHIIDSLYEAYNKLTEEGGANYPRYLLAATLLQAHAGSRPGRNKDSNELKKSKLYGALSLLGSHIHIKDGGKGVVVKFPGKSGVAQHIHIDDLRFVKVFDKIQKEQKKRLRQAKTQGYEVHDSNLFPGLIDKSSQQLKETLKQHLKPILQSKGIDLTEHEYDKVVTDPYAYRRAHFNLLLREIAHEAGRRLKATHTKNNQQYLSTEDYRKQRRDVFDLVSIFSGNRGETLDESYVLPGTFNTSFMAGYNSEQPSQANTEELNIEDIKKLPYAGKQTPYQENKLPSEELLNLEHADEPIKGNMRNDPLDDSEYLQVEDEGAPPETKNV
jgi:hypothetical protein